MNSLFATFFAAWLLKPFFTYQPNFRLLALGQKQDCERAAKEKEH